MVVDHGRGAKIYDVDGNEYIDLISEGRFGHQRGPAHPRVVKPYATRRRSSRSI